ncbi:hypothetical protein [Undibacterium sp. TJN19]|uniref:hypothetical protein n=1 Tax=Undibacterium sp. TJN19 TaxID=3413055 RepID=UPI003BF27D1F
MHQPFSISKKHSKRWLLCVLLPALLFAQWMGLSHRMSHAGWAGGIAPVSLTAQQIHASSTSLFDAQFFSGTKDDGGALHSCALYDAASTAEYLYHVPDAAILLTGVAIISKSKASVSWLALLLLPFSSRAPPSLSA